MFCAHAGQNVFRSSNGREYLLEEEQRGDDEVRVRAAGACFEGTGSRCPGYLRVYVLICAGRPEGCGHPGSYLRRSKQFPFHGVQVHGRLHGKALLQPSLIAARKARRVRH